MNISKDPTLKTLLIQGELQNRGLYHGILDNDWGTETNDAYQAFRSAILGKASPVSKTGMFISPDGLDMVKHFESLFLKAYKDGGGVWTIGWGHTGLQHMDGTVKAGRVVTVEEATNLLAYDMGQFEARVNSLVKVPLNQQQFDALVSFDFNTGGLTLKKGQPSTLLKKLNAGDYAGASAEFPKWNKDNGKVVKGLVRRRSAEREMFEGRDWKKFKSA